MTEKTLYTAPPRRPRDREDDLLHKRLPYHLPSRTQYASIGNAYFPKQVTRKQLVTGASLVVTSASLVVTSANKALEKA